MGFSTAVYGAVVMRRDCGSAHHVFTWSLRKYLGDYLASAIVYIISVNSLVAGDDHRAAYSFIVLFGLHWAIIPVVFSNIAHGGDPIYAIGGMSAIAQMGVALGSSSERVIQAHDNLPAVPSSLH